jgi:tRNA pseudouridine55 synthase
VLVGRATRLAPYLVGLDKRYRTTLRLGVRSDTGDPEGTLEPSGVAPPDAGTFAAVAARFTGTIEQVPPATSAIKLEGRRAYALARAGEAVEMPARQVRIDALDVLAYDLDAGTAELDVRCSKGTYVRSLARDLGDAAGCGAYCAALRRTAIGAFDVADAGSPDEVAASPGAGRWHRSPSEALAHLPARIVSGAEGAALAHGRALPLAGEDGPTRCLDAGRLVCVAEPEAGLLRPRVVLASGQA